MALSRSVNTDGHEKPSDTAEIAALPGAFTRKAEVLRSLRYAPLPILPPDAAKDDPAHRWRKNASPAVERGAGKAPGRIVDDYGVPRWGLLPDWELFVTGATKAQVAAWAEMPGANLGICTGQRLEDKAGAVSTLVAIDDDRKSLGVDSPADTENAIAEKAADYARDPLVAAVNALLGDGALWKRGRAGSTWIFRVKGEPPASKDFTGPNGEKIQLLAAGKQTVMPPSVHPFGRAYRYLRAPADGAAADTLPCVDLEAVVGLLADHGFLPGKASADGDVDEVRAAMEAGTAADDLFDRLQSHTGALGSLWRDGNDANGSDRRAELAGRMKGNGFTEADYCAAVMEWDHRLGEEGKEHDWGRENARTWAHANVLAEPTEAFSVPSLDDEEEPDPDLPRDVAQYIERDPLTAAFRIRDAIAGRRKKLQADREAFEAALVTGDATTELRKKIRAHTIKLADLDALLCEALASARVQEAAAAAHAGRETRDVTRAFAVAATDVDIPSPDADDDDIEAVRYAIPGLLPVGSHGLLFADSNQHKSFAVLRILWEAAMGRTPWGEPAGPRRRVLYLAAEGGAGGIGARLRGLQKVARRAEGEVDDVRGFFDVMTTETLARDIPDIDANLTDPNWVRRLAAHIRGRGYDVVVFDTLAMFAVGIDENASGPIGTVARNLKDLSAATGAATICIHHTNKGGNEYRGTSAIKGNWDVLWTFAREKAGADAPVGAEPGRALVSVKVRDDAPLVPLRLAVERVPLGTAGRGTLSVTLVRDPDFCPDDGAGRGRKPAKAEDAPGAAKPTAAFDGTDTDTEDEASAKWNSTAARLADAVDAAKALGPCGETFDRDEFFDALEALRKARADKAHAAHDAKVKAARGKAAKDKVRVEAPEPYAPFTAKQRRDAVAQLRDERRNILARHEDGADENRLRLHPSQLPPAG
jgi:hypothetical protein